MWICKSVVGVVVMLQSAKIDCSPIETKAWKQKKFIKKKTMPPLHSCLPTPRGSRLCMIPTTDEYVPNAAATTPRTMYKTDCRRLQHEALFTMRRKQRLGKMTDIVTPRKEPMKAITNPKKGTRRATNMALKTNAVRTSVPKICVPQEGSKKLGCLKQGCLQ